MSRNDSEKELVCESASAMLDSLLRMPGSFAYPFDSLRHIGKVQSQDGRLRIFTWNLPYNDGTHRYYGFIQYQDVKSSEVSVFKLTDMSGKTDGPADRPTNASCWYGSLIYEIIDNKQVDGTCYILLGYDPNNLFISRKIIDVLCFNDNNEPLFGYPVFYYEGKTRSRIIFEFSARAQMVLRWDASVNMIVFDHLSPSSSVYRNNRQYYGPDGSLDGFRFDKGMWQLVEDIDIRNMTE